MLGGILHFQGVRVKHICGITSQHELCVVIPPLPVFAGRSLYYQCRRVSVSTWVTLPASNSTVTELQNRR